MAGTWQCVQRAGREAGKWAIDARLCVWRANHEHPRHVYHAGRVEIQRLVERRRVLPRVRAKVSYSSRYIPNPNTYL